MKRVLTLSCCLAALLVVAGCSGSTEPQPVTTDEDKIAEFERMTEGEEEEAPAALEEDAGP